MGRLAKDGLDYFPVDVDIFEDDKMLMAQEIVDPDGKNTFYRFCVPYIAIRMLREIYRLGYYLPWDDQKCRRYASEIGNGITANVLTGIITALTKADFFDEEKLKDYNILTSRGIQKRWLHIKKMCRNKVNLIDENYILIDLRYPQSKKKNKLQKTKNSEHIPISSEDIEESSRRNAEILTKIPEIVSLYNNKDSLLGNTEYSSNITNYIKEKRKEIEPSEEMTISSEDIQESSEDITEPSEEKKKVIRFMGITSEDIAKTSEVIKYSVADLQLLQNCGEDFKETWTAWENFLIFKKKPNNHHTRKAQLDSLAQMSKYKEDVAILIVKKSISSNWVNLFPLKEESTTSKNGNGKLASAVMANTKDLTPEQLADHYKFKRKK